MKTILITAVAVFLSLGAVCQDKKITRTFSDVTSIQIETSSGDINLKRSQNAQVKLELTYSYSEDEYRPQIDQTGSKLVLTEKFTRGNHSGSAVWNLEVPEKIYIRLNTGSGDLSLDRINAEIKSNQGSGDAEITSFNGSINLNTGSGDINIDGVDAEVTLNTGSGDIRLKEGTGSFSVNAGSGSISLDQLKGDFSANTGSGNVRATAVAITGKSKFNTGSGNTTVTLATSLDHSISVNSGSGDATLNFNNNEISGEVIMTANKKQGEIVAPFKFDKEEIIEDDNGYERIEKTAKLGNKDITIRVGTGSGTAEIKK
jgi:DUF4097 and DUF4098 domain-containing protein YvlB